MNYYSKLYKAPDDKLIGMIAVDEKGSIYYVGQKQLVRPLDAFFSNHKNLYVQKKRDNVYYRHTIEPVDQETWLEEFRRQVPSPYYGGPVELTGGFIESIAQTWKQLGDKNGDFEERRY